MTHRWDRDPLSLSSEGRRMYSQGAGSCISTFDESAASRSSRLSLKYASDITYRSPPGSWLLLQNHGHHTSTHQVMKVNARHTTPTSRTAQLQLYSTVFGIVKLPALLMNVMIFTLHRTSAHRKRGHAIAHRGLDPQLHAPGVVHRNQSASTLPVCSLTDASLAMCDDWFCMLHMFHMPVASKCSPRRRPATDRNHD